MRDAIDVYAMTNPAFCSLVLRAFATGQQAADPRGTEYPLIFLVLPLVLSRDIAKTLQHTRETTGLMNWLTKNPLVLVNFAERVRESTNLTKEALLFGLRHGLMQFGRESRLLPATIGLTRKPNWPLADERGRALRDADRLGGWMGELQSMPTVFASFGVSP